MGAGRAARGKCAYFDRQDAGPKYFERERFTLLDGVHDFVALAADYALAKRGANGD